MGWLYMRSLGPHAGPREYLDAQFTFDRPDCRCRVLRSALLRLRTYYAAVERLRDTGERDVEAVVCLVRYNPRDREGYVFGYKAMSETMGLVESECPELILDLLTPTESSYALAWRDRCRANVRTRREASARRPRPGQTLALEVPLLAPDGRMLDRLEVVANPRSARTPLFRDPEAGGLYRIPDIRKRSYRLLG